ncbi:hypothetical protein [Oceanobacillus sp. J11TS1]|uniref:hypothetical protein n=1 Tax=Oceanobacillus sp. J11TS1 TaxID=2807191 RepID=UPI001B17F080|nr:hypothetical protein [Oceanobacillus sp. J11TS1]GIO22894.1 hypothetical protein J11TS1_14750 [Oceanobacillus sp. J11TS1]
MNALIFVLLCMIGLPLTVLIHETGHALAIIGITKKSKAKIHLGDFSDANKENFQIGRIHYHINWGISGTCYYINSSENITKFQRVIVALGGPVVSAACTIIFFNPYIY